MDSDYRLLPRAFQEDEQDRYRSGVKALVSGLPLPSVIICCCLRTPPERLLGPLREAGTLAVILIFLFFLVVVVYPLCVAGLGVGEIFQGVRIGRAKRAWLASASRDEFLIVERFAENDPYAETREEECICRLAVRVPRGGRSGAEVLWATVAPSIFERYRGMNSVPVRFCAVNSREFVIDGES